MGLHICLTLPTRVWTISTCDPATAICQNASVARNGIMPRMGCEVFCG